MSLSYEEFLCYAKIRRAELKNDSLFCNLEQKLLSSIIKNEWDEMGDEERKSFSAGVSSSKDTQQGLSSTSNVVQTLPVAVSSVVAPQMQLSSTQWPVDTFSRSASIIDNDEIFQKNSTPERIKSDRTSKRLRMTPKHILETPIDQEPRKSAEVAYQMKAPIKPNFKRGDWVWIKNLRSKYNGCPALVRDGANIRGSKVEHRVYVYYRLSRETDDYVYCTTKFNEESLVTAEEDDIRLILGRSFPKAGTTNPRKENADFAENSIFPTNHSSNVANPHKLSELESNAGAGPIPEYDDWAKINKPESKYHGQICQLKGLTNPNCRRANVYFYENGIYQLHSNLAVSFKNLILLSQEEIANFQLMLGEYFPKSLNKERKRNPIQGEEGIRQPQKPRKENDCSSGHSFIDSFDHDDEEPDEMENLNQIELSEPSSRRFASITTSHGPPLESIIKIVDTSSKYHNHFAQVKYQCSSPKGVYLIHVFVEHKPNTFRLENVLMELNNYVYPTHEELLQAKLLPEGERMNQVKSGTI